MNGGTCEISEEGDTDVANWLIRHDRADDCPKMKFWGHSHHTMGVAPSSQDEHQSMAKIHKGSPYLIRAICNKKGDMSVSFFDWTNKIRFDNINWKIENSGNNAIDEQKLTEIGSIIASNDSPSDKLKSILTVISIDKEDCEIRDKIAKLKVENTPKSKVEAHSSRVLRNWERDFPPISAENTGRSGGFYQGYPRDEKEFPKYQEDPGVSDDPPEDSISDYRFPAEEELRFKTMIEAWGE
jgi:hypothetical protein